MGEIKGYISQVIGPVVDIHFDYGTEETVTLPPVSYTHLTLPTKA